MSFIVSSLPVEHIVFLPIFSFSTQIWSSWRKRSPLMIDLIPQSFLLIFLLFYLSALKPLFLYFLKPVYLFMPGSFTAMFPVLRKVPNTWHLFNKYVQVKLINKCFNLEQGLVSHSWINGLLHCFKKFSWVSTSKK